MNDIVQRPFYGLFSALVQSVGLVTLIGAVVFTVRASDTADDAETKALDLEEKVEAYVTEQRIINQNQQVFNAEVKKDIKHAQQHREDISEGIDEIIKKLNEKSM